MLDNLSILKAENVIEVNILTMNLHRTCLTQTGESLMPIVYSLIAWAKENFDTIMLHRKKAGRK